MTGIDIPYKSLEHTLKALKIQVMDSIPYMHEYIPEDIKSPKELFYFLKSKVKYKNDPVEGKDSIELLQTVPTLMDNGGKGDCDCFTILTLASNYFLGFEPQYVALVGKTTKGPTHIYSEVYDPDKKKICAMDLTNPVYCMERPYKYKQRLRFKL
jgi:hypothetical protein